MKKVKKFEKSSQKYPKIPKVSLKKHGLKNKSRKIRTSDFWKKRAPADGKPIFFSDALTIIDLVTDDLNIKQGVPKIKIFD